MKTTSQLVPAKLIFCLALGGVLLPAVPVRAQFGTNTINIPYVGPMYISQLPVNLNAAPGVPPHLFSSWPIVDPYAGYYMGGMSPYGAGFSPYQQGYPAYMQGYPPGMNATAYTYATPYGTGMVNGYGMPDLGWLNNVPGVPPGLFVSYAPHPQSNPPSPTPSPAPSPAPTPARPAINLTGQWIVRINGAVSGKPATINQMGNTLQITDQFGNQKTCQLNPDGTFTWINTTARVDGSGTHIMFGTGGVWSRS